MDTRPIQTDQGTKHVSDIPFESLNESWSEYTLSDGSVIRIRTVVTGVIRVQGEYDDQGRPLYLVQSQNIMSVVKVLPELCKSPDEE